MGGERSQVRLDQVCASITRGTSPVYTENDGLLVLNQKCIRNYRVNFSNARRTDNISRPVKQERFLRSLDIVVNSTGTGTLGRVGQISNLPEPATIDSHVTLIRPDAEKVDPRFLGFVLKSLQSEIEALAEGSTGQTELARGKLAALEFFLPPMNEQHAIGYLLGSLDDKIDLLREMNRTLEESARTLFRTWFVDFLPVRAKATGATSFRGMPQALFDTLPDSFEVSEIGEIPNGWRIKPLGRIVSQPIKRGLMPRYVNSGGMAVLNQKCIRNWEVDHSLARRHDAVEKSPGDKAIKINDILINSTGVGTLGRVAQIHELREPATIDSHLSLVRPDPDKVSPLFLGFSLTERENEIERLGHGSTGQTELSRHRLAELAISLPENELQQSFSDFVQPMVSLKTCNSAEISTLTTLRDTLLPKLISGELEVPHLATQGMKDAHDGG